MGAWKSLIEPIIQDKDRIIVQLRGVAQFCNKQIPDPRQFEIDKSHILYTLFK